MAEVQKSAFLLSGATVMIGRAFVDDVFSLTPDQHSVGMAQEVRVVVDSARNELANGVAQSVVDSKRTNVRPSITANIFEFTAQNFRLAQGRARTAAQVQRAVLVADALAGATSLALSSNPIPGEPGSALAAVSSGASILIQQADGTDYVFPTKASAASTLSNGIHTVPIAGSFQVPPGMAFPAGSMVWIVDEVTAGGINEDDLFCVKVSGTLSNFNRPVVYVAPKVRMVKGFEISFSETQYGSMPWEMSPQLLSKGEVASFPRLFDVGTKRSGLVYVSAGAGAGADSVILPAPTISFTNSSAVVSEGNTGTTTVTNTINVNRDGLTGPLVVNLTTGGTATAGVDYVAGPASVTIADGANSASYMRVVNGDTDIETDETIIEQAVLSGYPSAKATKTITITNDDVAPTISFVNGTAIVTEGNSGTTTVTNTINVTRNGVTGPLVVNLTTGGTATPGVDYVAGPTSVTIADGASSASYMRVVNGDTDVEADETIIEQAVLAAYPSATATKVITITNDDVTVTPVTPVTAFDGMWTDQIASTGWYPGAVGWNAFYDAASSKTYMAAEEVNPKSPSFRTSRLYAFDAAGNRAGPYKLFDSLLTDDDHGVPNIAMAANRRMYATGGEHSGTNMQFSMSGVDDFTNFTAIPGPTVPANAGEYAYPHLVFRTATEGNLIRRKKPANVSKMVLVDQPFTINADGTLAWGQEVTLFDFGDGSRFYALDPFMLPNGKMRIAGIMADFNDTYRQDLFVGDYDLTAKTIASTLDGTALPVPVGLTGGSGARAKLRYTSQWENSLYTTAISHYLDATGNYHVVYMESANANSTANAPLPIMYRQLPAGSQTLTAPVQVATVYQRYNGAEIMRGASEGLVDMYFVSQNPAYTFRGGDISKRTRSADGTWSDPVIFQTASAYAPLGSPHRVLNGENGPIQAIVHEASYAENGNTGGSFNPTNGTLRAYAYTYTGRAKITIPNHPKLATALQRLSTQPSALSVQIANQVLRGYDNMGILATRDIMHLQASRLPNEADLARLDMIGTRDLTMNSGMSFAQVAGKAGYAWLGDGVTGVQATGYVPSTMGVNMQQNNLAVIFDVLTDGQRTPAVFNREYSSSSTASLLCTPRNASDQIAYRANDTTTSTATNTTAIGSYVLRRVDANNKTVFKDGASVSSAAKASVSPPTTQMLWGGGGAGDGGPSGTYQVSLGSFGSAFSVAADKIRVQLHYRFKQEMGVL